MKINSMIKHRIAKLLLCSISFFTVVSCDEKNKSSDYLVFDKIKYVTRFPQSFELDKPVEIDLESMNLLGVQNFRIYDSLLVLSVKDQNGVWAFVSLPDFQLRGKFLSIGRGPNEFIFSPQLDPAAFVTKNGERYVNIYDSQTGQLYEMNIDKSIRNQETDISVKSKLPPFLFSFCMIDSVTFFCKEINDSETKQERYIWSKGQKTIATNFEKPNQASITSGEDFNILATLAMYDFSRQRIIETPVYLNYINVYSLDDSFSKTICLGKKATAISNVQMVDQWDRVYTFGELRLFPQFWGVIFINENKKDFQIGRKTHSSILFFDWNGEPLAELKTNSFITSFDIDLSNGYLYTCDHQTDKFCKYDIRDIIDKLNDISYSDKKE